MFRDEYHLTELEWIQMPGTGEITDQTVSNKMDQFLENHGQKGPIQVCKITKKMD